MVAAAAIPSAAPATARCVRRRIRRRSCPPARSNQADHQAADSTPPAPPRRASRRTPRLRDANSRQCVRSTTTMANATSASSTIRVPAPISTAIAAKRHDQLAQTPDIHRIAPAHHPHQRQQHAEQVHADVAGLRNRNCGRPPPQIESSSIYCRAIRCLKYPTTHSTSR